MKLINWLSCLISVVAGSQAMFPEMIQNLVNKGNSLRPEEMFPLDKTSQRMGHFTADMEDYVKDAETIIEEIFKTFIPDAVRPFQGQEGIEMEFDIDGDDDGYGYTEATLNQGDYTEYSSYNEDEMSVVSEDGFQTDFLQDFISDEILNEAMLDLFVLDRQILSMANKLCIPLPDLEARREKDPQALEHYTVINLYRIKLLKLLGGLKTLLRRLYPQHASLLDYKFPDKDPSA